MPTLEPSPPRRRGARVTAVALLSALACFPREDLNDYSRAWANQPAGGGGSPASPAVGADAGGSAGELTPPRAAGAGAEAPEVVDAGDAASPADAAVADAAVDAGPAPVDAGAIELADTGPDLAQLCADLNGSLEPGTRNCFVVSSAVATWAGAAEACTGLGMQLAAVTTSETDDFIATLTPAAVWLGGRDPAFFTFPAFANPAANTFSWLDGTAVTDINWAAGEPNAGVGEFCIEKSNQLANEPWFDRNCNELELYVCQRTL